MPLLIVLAVYFFLVLVWPMLRLRRRTGEWGLVSQRGADSCQRPGGAR